MKLKPFLPLISIGLFTLVLPIITSILGVNYLQTQLTMAAYYALVALGLCLLLGYAGQISLGQAGFFAIGGYVSAILSKAGLDPRLAFIAAVLSAALVALAIGMPVLRLKGHYLAMATLGFGVVVEKFLRGMPALGGADGISDVPAFPLFGPLAITGGRSDRLANFIIAFLVLTLARALLSNLLKFRSGRALRALHGSEEAANAMGVNTARSKLLAFVIAAVAAAVAGSLLTHYNGSIGPGEASVMKSIRYLSIVAVGGLSNFAGTLLMGITLNFLSLRGAFGVYDDAVFGAILVLMMLVAPDGFTLRLPGIFKKKKNGPSEASGD